MLHLVRLAREHRQPYADQLRKAVQRVRRVWRLHHAVAQHVALTTYMYIAISGTYGR